MKKLLTLLFFFPLFALAQTCDVDLIGFNPETNQISVAILNGENCGCNEYTQQDGNTCDDSPSSVITNNESITHFVFGLHIYQDFTEGPCSQANFHPGWAFAYPPNQVILTPETGHQTGDTVNFELVTFNDWDCLLEQDFDEECLELVVWQINLSQTADPESFPNEFWTDTCGTCANETQIYPDIDLSNNTLVWCPDQVPPSPLYPGCTDEEANNFDPSATWDDGSCTYTILGCTTPTACNYNQFATENDGSCVFCFTEFGDSLCNAYHNSETYWDWYISIFDCEVDHQIDSTFFVEAGCNLLGSGAGCNPQLRFHTDHTNVGDIPLYSWYFTYWSGDWIVNTGEYGVNFNGGDTPYSIPLPAGQSGNTLQTFVFQGFEWEEGDTLWIESKVIGDQVDVDLSNNIAYFILPEYPICQFGCTDPEAVNFNPDATCSDESCEYPLPELIYIDYECDLNCDDTLAWYNAITFFENIGNTPITSFCIEWDIIGFNQEFIECFEGELLPGEDIILEFSTITSDGGGGVVIRLLELNGVETDITWFQPTSCYQDAVATCIFGCTDPEASNYNPAAEWDDGSCEYDVIELTYIDAECYVDCDLSGPFYYVNTTWTNTGTVEITNFCAEWDIIGGEFDDLECWDGSLLPSDTVMLQFGPYNSNATPVAWAYLQVLNNVVLDPQIENYEILYCWGDAEASCVYGCTDIEAFNYNPDADLDDGSCNYDLWGCTDPEAINYNALATLDDGSCVYPPDPEPCDGTYFAPNTFTPNNDGWNDGWAVVVTDETCWKDWSVQIFNRWGGLVWESYKVGEVWPGSVFDGNHYVADGVYLYKVQGVGWDPSNTFTKTGHITIFR